MGGRVIPSLWAAGVLTSGVLGVKGTSPRKSGAAGSAAGVVA